MKNVVLIGFMGTGKTHTGRLLAKCLGRTFVDTDKKIEADNEMTISRMFAEHGEPYFRTKEKEAVAAVAASRDLVIATGGGVILNPDNVAALRATGVIIALTADVEIILERTGRRNTRPLLDTDEDERRQRIISLLAQRTSLYQNAADFMIDTGARSPQQVIDSIMAWLRQGGHIDG